MNDESSRQSAGERKGGPAAGAAAIVLAGIVLGLAYNAFGLSADRLWGLPWIAENKLAGLEKVGDSSGGAGSGEAGPGIPQSYSTNLDDPLAIPGSAFDGGGLPEIPAVGRPVQIELGALRAYFDADAALIVDARDPDEYAAGHIPGAVNLPYDEVISNPSLVETLRTGGRPIVTYCGGDGCEVSLAVAEELCGAGQSRVAVYVGGFPEWVAAGNPVERGPSAHEEKR